MAAQFRIPGEEEIQKKSYDEKEEWRVDDGPMSSGKCYPGLPVCMRQRAGEMIAFRDSPGNRDGSLGLASCTNERP